MSISENKRQSGKQIHLSKTPEAAHQQPAQNLLASELRYRRLFETAQDGILILDGTTGKIEDVNPFLIRMLGYTKEEFIGKQLWQIGAFRDVKRSKAAFNKLQKNDFIRYDNMPLETKTGQLFAVEFISNAYAVDHRRVIQCNIRDITKREKLKNKLRSLATHDRLTALPNRVLLFDRFAIAMATAQRQQKGLALMSLDLDKFKIINDTLGHDTGDRVLVAASRRLLNLLRKLDTVARIGGDEFILLISGFDNKAGVIKVAQKIVAAFRRPLIIKDQKLTVTVSIGIALFPEDGKDIKELLKKSDELLYLVKASGRNNYQMSS